MADCPTCGEPTPDLAKFCPACGSPLDAASSRAENRFVTVLFADMAGSVEATASLSAEQAAETVSGLLAAMAVAVRRQEGRIDRFLGDGILATFGTPVAHEDDAERAIRAALDIRGAARARGFSTSAGINSGEVYFGRVGSPGHEETTVMGPAVNLAARLQSHAGSGGVLVGRSTYGLAPAFRFEPVGLTVKGIHGRVEAFRVEGESGTSARDAHEAPLVGRTAELDALRNSVPRPGSGARLVLVEAEAGIGKSRLVRELRASLDGEGALWLEGHCRRSRAGVSYAPWREILTGLGSQTGSWRALLERLESEGHISGQDAGDMRPWLSALLEGQTLAAVGPEQAKMRTFVSCQRLMAAAARLQPMVVSFEDLHWSDPLSLELLQALAGGVREAPVTLLVTTRPAAAEGVVEPLLSRWGQRMRHLRLEPLGGPDIGSLTETLLGGPIDPALQSILADRAEGVPLFAEELVRSLRDQGALTQRDGRWRLREGMKADALPSGLHAMIQSRVDSLEDGDRQVLRQAAVLGVVFPRDVLEAMNGAAIDAQIERLQRRGLIIGGSGTEATFRHALIQDTVHRGLVRADRQALHAAAASAYESRSVDTATDAGWASIAYHHERSAEAARAVPFLLLAGEAALKDFGNAAARDFFARAIRLCETPAADEADLSRALEGLGDALRGLGAEDNGWDAFTRALTLVPSDEVARRVRLMRKRADAAFHGRRFDRVGPAADEGRREAAVAPEDPAVRRELAALEMDACWTSYFRHDLDELRDALERARPLLAKEGTDVQRARLSMAETLLILRRTMYRMDEHLTKRYDESVRLARRSGDLGTLAFTRFGRGFVLLFLGRLEEARHDLEPAREMSRRIGDWSNLLRCRIYLAVLARLEGDVDAAAAEAMAAHGEALEHNVSEYVGASAATLAWAAYRQGDAEACTRWIGLARDNLVDNPIRFPFRWMVEAVALQLAHDADDDDAMAYSVELLANPWQQGMEAEAEEALAGAARAFSAGRHGEARGHVETLLAWFRGKGRL